MKRKPKRRTCGVYFVMRCKLPEGHRGRCKYVGPRRHHVEARPACKPKAAMPPGMLSASDYTEVPEERRAAIEATR